MPLHVSVPFLRPSSGGSWTVLCQVTKLRSVDRVVWFAAANRTTLKRTCINRSHLSNLTKYCPQAPEVGLKNGAETCRSKFLSVLIWILVLFKVYIVCAWVGVLKKHSHVIDVSESSYGFANFDTEIFPFLGIYNWRCKTEYAPVSLVGFIVGYTPPIELKQEKSLCPHTWYQEDVYVWLICLSTIDNIN